MCRWLAYLGSPITLDRVVTKPNHSLIDQSLLARDLFLPTMGMASQFERRAFPTNGDGFGIAWSGREGKLAQYRQAKPAWDSQNLRVLAAEIESPCFLAHVRAAPGGSISQQNTHPFVHGKWMFQHNGEIGDFSSIKRELTMDVDPALYPSIQGNTDSEVCFFLALTFGLATDPVSAIAKMIARVEKARTDSGITAPFRGSFCASDGSQLVVARWVSPDASVVQAPSLYHSSGAISLDVDPSFSGANEGNELLPDDTQLVVSEPLELHWSKRTWHEVPTASIGVFSQGADPTFTALPLSPGGNKNE